MQYQSSDMVVNAGQIPFWKKGKPEAIKKNEKMSLKRKKIMLDCDAISVLRYGSEDCAISFTVEEKINVVKKKENLLLDSDAM